MGFPEILRWHDIRDRSSCPGHDIAHREGTSRWDDGGELSVVHTLVRTLMGRSGTAMLGVQDQMDHEDVHVESGRIVVQHDNDIYLGQF